MGYKYTHLSLYFSIIFCKEKERENMLCVNVCNPHADKKNVGYTVNVLNLLLHS